MLITPHLPNSNTTLVKVKFKFTPPITTINVIQIQLLLKLNRKTGTKIKYSHSIQIQLLLKLNELKLFPHCLLSNIQIQLLLKLNYFYICYNINIIIQIQLLLKLNTFKAPNKPPVISNSNTTLVKVK